MIKRIANFIIAVLLISILGGTYLMSFPAFAENVKAKNKEILPNAGIDYSAYQIAYTDLAPAESDIQISGDKIIKLKNSFIAVFNVPKNGKYELLLKYKSKDTENAVVSFEIDNKIPFENAERLNFPVYWVNDGECRTDGKGNEFSPNQIIYDGFVSVKARDYSGQYEAPYLFALSSGEHTLTVTVKQGDIDISEIELLKPDKAASYTAPADNKYNTANTEPIVLEGEKAFLKNSRSLIPLSDSASAAVNPAEPGKTKLNYIGGTNWQRPGSLLSWDFYVETAGYYSLAFLYRQNYNLGSVSYRSLQIDGKTPFEEAERVKFFYTSKWRYMNYANGENPYWIYLDAGKHTLTLTATVGEISDIYLSLKDTTALMGDLYVDITKIIGETVDVYRSYELFKQIPDFNERLTKAAESLNAIADKVEALQEKKSGSQVSIMRNAYRVIKQMLDNPYTAHRYKSDFYDGFTNLSALMGEITNMPLDIDRIFIRAYDGKEAEYSAPFAKRAAFSLKRFFYSFTDDYSMKTDDEKDSLTIWVNWGRDQAQVLNSLIQDRFVRDTGIKTDVHIVNATLIQAVLAGDGPDVMVQLTRTEPLNYAMRGALYDLNNFDDLSEILKRFNEGADIPYRYEGGLYALPDTQSFNLMFVRTDILNEMGAEIPKTWDEFIELSNLLKRNNLQAYIPGQTTTYQSIYPTLLIQNGLSLYNEALTASTLTELPQIKVFTEMTNWYTKYKLPVTMDLYNRFRIGSVPIGIGDYTLYTQLKAAAPEIEGRWTVTELPGVKDKSGEINRRSAGTGTGCAITRFAENPDNAWRFLKWWTSAETQYTYSTNLESAIGPLGRIAASNTEAFAEMDWDADMKKSILSQQHSIEEMPEVPGSYYTARSITQSFWETVEQGRPAMEAVTKWGAILDNEIARKRAEYISDK